MDGRKTFAVHSRFLVPVYRRNHRRFFGSSPTRQPLTAGYFRNSGHRQTAGVVRHVASRERERGDRAPDVGAFTSFFACATLHMCLPKYKRDRSVGLITPLVWIRERERSVAREDKNFFAPLRSVIISRIGEIK